MTVRPILRWPDPRLTQRCAPATGAEGLVALIEDLFDTMYAAPGRGLAAPQIGVMLRVFVMDIGWRTGDATPKAFVDPKILWASTDRTQGQEACLSIPGISATVTRPGRIGVAALDAQGSPVTHALAGAEARCAQHELDHLDGLVTFDRVDPAQRTRLTEAYTDAVG
ncbi:MAG: peptide deformylase [Pseudomonadota bacterium]